MDQGLRIGGYAPVYIDLCCGLNFADEKSFRPLSSESESKLHVHQDAFERNIYEHQHV